MSALHFLREPLTRKVRAMTGNLPAAPIAVTLTEAEATPEPGAGVTADTLAEWQELSGGLIGFFTERGYRVALQTFSVAPGSRSLILNVYFP